jgi:hypothetical protein
MNMKTITKISLLGTALAAWLPNPSTPPLRAAEASEEQRPLVEIALLLDTSNSMDGLIDQAKSQLWKVVNEFIKARQNGKQPEVHVALFEYGKSSLPASEGYIRLIQPLTHDLDKVSEELFALKTNGGDEYCGWVIREAVTRLSWSSSPDVYRAIFIAGNEPFTQGRVPYAESCKAAIAKGIIVNTIHCGNEAEGVNTKWKDGAILADGKYMFIDQNQAVVHFAAPQDAEIARLSTELNKTYLPYGASGNEAAERQVAQDANALSMAASGSVVNRAVTKSSANYRNDGWDLVDAVNNGRLKLSDVKNEELPAEMQKMTASERAAFVEAKLKERTEIQVKIQALNDARNKYVAEQMKTSATAGANTLDAAMLSAVREQAVRNNFEFK